MSIFDEVLILIDDQNGLTGSEIEFLLDHYTKQAIGSTLGRLTSRGWLAAQSEAAATRYRLTQAGNQYMHQVLAAIHRTEQVWPATWFCVVASLPEAQRRERDMLRHYLASRGFGRLVDGFWIHPWNRQTEVAQLIRRLGIGTSVFMFLTQPFGQATLQVAISQGWNWAELHRRHREFIEHGHQQAARLAAARPAATDRLGLAQRRHRAKCLVFEYGQLLDADPTLPIALTPDQTNYATASAIYHSVRQYCYPASASYQP